MDLLELTAILGHVGLGVGKLLTGGGCGIWTIVDWFLIMDATRQTERNQLKNFILLHRLMKIYFTRLWRAPPAFLDCTSYF